VGRKSREKRDRYNQPIDLIRTAAQSIVVLMLDDGSPIEQLLNDPVLTRKITPQNILGIAQTFQRKTPEQRAEMVTMAERFANLAIETTAGRK
jgi:hypothetical protein